MFNLHLIHVQHAKHFSLTIQTNLLEQYFKSRVQQIYNTNGKLTKIGNEQT